MKSLALMDFLCIEDKRGKGIRGGKDGNETSL